MGSVGLSKHRKAFTEGKFTSVKDVPILRLMDSMAYDKPFYTVDTSKGYGTKMDGEIVYIQHRDKDEWVYNFAGMAMSESYPTFTAAKNAYGDVERKFKEVSAGRREMATRSLSYVNNNRKVSPADFNSRRREIESDLRKRGIQ